MIHIYIEYQEDFIDLKTNEILDKIMVRANDRCISFHKKITCSVLDKITISYSTNGTQAKKWFYISVRGDWTSITAKEIVIPEIKFEDERSKIIEKCHLNNIEYFDIENNNLNSIDLDIILLNILQNISYPINIPNMLTKKALHEAGHWLRYNKSINIKNIICNHDYSSYNELLKYTKEDDGLISKNKIKIYPKFNGGDIKSKQYLYDESILLLPKRKQTGAFYLFDRNISKNLNSFFGSYYYLDHCINFGVCLFGDNGQFVSIGKKGF